MKITTSNVLAIFQTAKEALERISDENPNPRRFYIGGHISKKAKKALEDLGYEAIEC